MLLNWFSKEACVSKIIVTISAVPTKGMQICCISDSIFGCRESFHDPFSYGSTPTLMACMPHHLMYAAMPTNNNNGCGVIFEYLEFGGLKLRDATSGNTQGRFEVICLPYWSAVRLRLCFKLGTDIEFNKISQFKNRWLKIERHHYTWHSAALAGGMSCLFNFFHKAGVLLKGVPINVLEPLEWLLLGEWMEAPSHNPMYHKADALHITARRTSKWWGAEFAGSVAPNSSGLDVHTAYEWQLVAFASGRLGCQGSSSHKAPALVQKLRVSAVFKIERRTVQVQDQFKIVRQAALCSVAQSHCSASFPRWPTRQLLNLRRIQRTNENSKQIKQDSSVPF